MDRKTKESILAEIKKTKSYYAGTLNSPTGQKMMEDLAVFCRANVTTFHTDPRIQVLLEARREVYLRMVKYRDQSAESIAATVVPRFDDPVTDNEDLS